LFQTKTTSELAFSLFVFKMCEYSYLVDYGARILAISDSWSVSAPYWFIKKTFFRQFCAGESLSEAKKVGERLSNEGIGLILDYAVEDSLTEEAWNTHKSKVIEHIQNSDPKSVKFVPLKLTSLLPPQLLEFLTANMRENPALSVLPSSNKDLKSAPVFAVLDSNQKKQLLDAYERVVLICKAAENANIGILVDAEQTNRQPAVDFLTLAISQKANKNKAVVYNTYQFYLMDTLQRFQQHMEFAKKEKFHFAAKLVRGAYLQTESKRAAETGKKSLVYSTKIHTDGSYNTGVKLILNKMGENEKVAAMIATHNLESVMRACQQLRELQIPSNHPNVHFGQLFGMADHLTYGLAYLNFNSCKLVPFGEIKTVTGYLTRRLQENRDVLGGTMIERQLLWTELLRRTRVFSPSKATY